MHLCRKNRAKDAHFSTRWSAIQRRDEVPQLHGRKFPETILDLALGPLQEDPARGAAALAAHEVHATPHRAASHFCIGLHLDIHVPALVAALQFAHVLGALLAWEGGAHGPVGERLTPDTLRCPWDSCQR